MAPVKAWHCKLSAFPFLQTFTGIVAAIDGCVERRSSTIVAALFVPLFFCESFLPQMQRQPNRKPIVELVLGQAVNAMQRQKPRGCQR